MVFEITEYERILKILAVLYVKEPTAGYIDYFKRSRAFAAWLLPEIPGSLPLVPQPQYSSEFDGYTVQQLARIWKVDARYCRWLLEWAKVEVDKHDTSYPQTTFPF